MRFIGAILLLALVPGVLAGFFFGGGVFLRSPCVLPVLIGLAVGLVLDYILFRKVPGLETFEHELTHAVAALMFLRRVTSLRVTRHQGGSCGHSSGFGGRLGDDFIGMAPYVLPTFTFLSIAVRPLVPTRFFPWFDVWIGITFGYHLLSNIREVRRNWHGSWFTSVDGEYTQTDLGSRGLLFSLVYILVVSLAILGMMAAVIALGYRGVVDWASHLWNAEAAAVSWALHKVARIVSRG